MIRLLYMACLLFGLTVALPARADEPVRFEALLIRASNDRAPIDRRLEKVEYRLRRMVKFEHFHHAGEGQSQATLPAEFDIDLGSGNKLHVKARRHDGRIRAEVQWIRDGKSVLNSTVNMQPGAHAIFGGIAVKDGTLMISLVCH